MKITSFLLHPVLQAGVQPTHIFQPVAIQAGGHLHSLGASQQQFDHIGRLGNTRSGTEVATQLLAEGRGPTYRVVQFAGESECVGAAQTLFINVNIHQQGFIENSDATDAHPRELLQIFGQVGEIGADLDADGYGYRFLKSLYYIAERAVNIVVRKRRLKRHDCQVQLQSVAAKILKLAGVSKPVVVRVAIDAGMESLFLASAIRLKYCETESAATCWAMYS